MYMGIYMEMYNIMGTLQKVIVLHSLTFEIAISIPIVELHISAFLMSCLESDYLFQSTWRSSWENRPWGLCRCHTKSIHIQWTAFRLRFLNILEKLVSCQKKDGRGYAHPSLFWHDNDKDLKVCFLVAHITLVRVEGPVINGLFM